MGTVNEQIAAAIVLVVAFIVTVALLFLYNVESAPEHARVLADGERRTYASTPCVIFNKLERELIVNRIDKDKKVSDEARKEYRSYLSSL